MNEVIALLIAALACFRLSELITVDDGPGDCLKNLRARLGAYNLDESGLPDSSIGRGMVCPYCIGIWIALVLALVVFPIGPLTLVYWFAIAGGQAALQNVFGRV